VVDPLQKREGNLRFAGIASSGYPLDPLGMVEELRQRLTACSYSCYGAASLLFSLPPEEHPSSAWECLVGTAVIGLPQVVPGVQIEDYRALHALSLPHGGAIRDLSATVRRLADHGRSLGYRVRPYWRIALRSRMLGDGNILPSADVAVFLDR
jgi:hypothetical protein